MGRRKLIINGHYQFLRNASGPNTQRLPSLWITEYFSVPSIVLRSNNVTDCFGVPQNVWKQWRSGCTTCIRLCGAGRSFRAGGCALSDDLARQILGQATGVRETPDKQSAKRQCK